MTYLIAMIAVFLGLYCTRPEVTPRFVFIQLSLEIGNICNLLCTLVLADTVKPSHVVMTALYSVSFVLYTLGHWVFIRQYFKVS